MLANERDADPEPARLLANDMYVAHQSPNRLRLRVKLIVTTKLMRKWNRKVYQSSDFNRPRQSETGAELIDIDEAGSLNPLILGALSTRNSDRQLQLQARAHPH